MEGVDARLGQALRGILEWAGQVNPCAVLVIRYNAVEGRHVQLAFIQHKGHDAILFVEQFG